MLVSILVYGAVFGPAFAVGFVLLIFVHEMGHVLALRWYGVRSSPPLFIPFVGAVITVPRLRDAKEEAVVGIGGPVTGTAGAPLLFAYARFTHSPLLLDLAYYGFMLNLLNLMPIPPLDGGRITAAVSPWVWPLGLLAVVAMIVGEFISAGRSVTGVSPILVLLLVYAAPRRGACSATASAAPPITGSVEPRHGRSELPMSALVACWG